MIPKKTFTGRIERRLFKLCLAWSNEIAKWSIPAEDSKLRRHLLISLGLKIDNPVFIDAGFNCEYGHNISIGKFTFLRENAFLGDWEKIEIGNGNSISRNLSIFTGGHNTDNLWPKLSPVEIGNFCYIGANVTILPGVHIGDDSIIGAGCVVNRDIPERSIVVGIPGKIISKRNVIPDIIYTGFGLINRNDFTRV